MAGRADAARTTSPTTRTWAARSTRTAKLPGQGEASRVADALSRDGEVCDRYMTAVVARVCGVDWPTARGLIREPTMFARPALVAGRFAHEAVSSRDAGARWCSAAMLLALSPMIERSSSWS
jgi:hypothetical protein